MKTQSSKTKLHFIHETVQHAYRSCSLTKYRKKADALGTEVEIIEKSFVKKMKITFFS